MILRRRVRRQERLVRRADRHAHQRSAQSQLMHEEIFGPVLTVFVYDDARVDETLALVRPATALRAHRRDLRAATAPRSASSRARCASPPATSTSTTSPPAPSSASSRSAAPGVGHQRQGRHALNLLRWVSPRTIKENFVPPTDFATRSWARQMKKEAIGVNWSGRRDLNSRPPEPHSGTLPGCATSRRYLACSGRLTSASINCCCSQRPLPEFSKQVT